MEKLTDEALVVMYQAGNENAMDILLKKYKGIVRHKASAMFIIGGDTDDLIQEGMIGLYKAVISYSSDKNTSFATFASTCINRNMITAIEKANRQKNLPLNTSISFETKWGAGDEDEITLGDVIQAGAGSNPENLVIGQEQYEDLLQKISSKLSSYERKILAYHMKGLGYTEIASKLHKSPKSIDNALQRIKNKVLNLLEL